MPHRLDSLLRPRSIAVLGATERMGTVGRHTIENLLKGGYPGRLHAVNPGHQSVCGVPCFASLAALPEPVEHVIFAIGDARVEAALDDVVETAESREFNEILKRDVAKAAIAWRSARAGQQPTGKKS